MALDLSQIEVADFLSELGMNNIREDGNQVWFSCPSDVHYRGDANPSANMEKGTTRHFCFSCGRSGNAISFLADLENVSPIQSALWIKERFGGGSNYSKQKTVLENVKDILKKPEEIIYSAPKYPEEEECTRRKIDWKSIEAYLKFIGCDDWRTAQDAPLFYMLNRGFTAETLNKWDIGWDKISERISIPVRNEEGKLVGFKARGYEKEPRYLVLGGEEYGFEPYETKKIVFGLDKVGKQEELILCEGELNAIAMHQHDYKNTVGISGKILSDEQAELLIKNTNRVMLIFDEEGDAFKAAQKIDKIVPTTIIKRHEKDPADSTQAELTKLLTRQKSMLEFVLAK